MDDRRLLKILERLVEITDELSRMQTSTDPRDAVDMINLHELECHIDLGLAAMSRTRWGALQ